MKQRQQMEQVARMEYHGDYNNDDDDNLDDDLEVLNTKKRDRRTIEDYEREKKCGRL